MSNISQSKIKAIRSQLKTISNEEKNDIRSCVAIEALSYENLHVIKIPMIFSMILASGAALLAWLIA